MLDHGCSDFLKNLQKDDTHTVKLSEIRVEFKFVLGLL